MTRKANTNSAIILLLGAVVTIVVAAIAISSFQDDMGLAEPSRGTVETVAELEAARAVLAAGGSYEEYSQALRVGVASFEGMALHNAADSKARAQLLGSVECLRVAREAWQAELEGEWSEETYGSAQYWRAAHATARLDLPDGALSADDVIDAALACATGGLAEVAEKAERVDGS